jgi:hypothetical protein
MYLTVTSHQTYTYYVIMNNACKLNKPKHYKCLLAAFNSSVVLGIGLILCVWDFSPLSVSLAFQADLSPTSEVNKQMKTNFNGASDRSDCMWFRVHDSLATVYIKVILSTGSADICITKSGSICMLNIENYFVNYYVQDGNNCCQNIGLLVRLVISNIFQTLHLCSFSDSLHFNWF